MLSKFISNQYIEISIYYNISKWFFISFAKFRYILVVYMGVGYIKYISFLQNIKFKKKFKINLTKIKNPTKRIAI